ncbi:arabinan endo-1,5-alpha-L-arabinosidase [Demequina mangrovi]|uniref:Arabinan endo-1,5-alpha-L-arabinosidase n=1 Tax=Demequina mangrovi TaxID=1043493 RepID=A0A1H6W4U7_9MICO|nr:arabinan endo-1,5-alpha-L-arabinosidase [Demequina mangrovi]SEJ10806.1 arabinan endo-1,5-alpha-L-arabinosidase [Demequina mangrovi]
MSKRPVIIGAVAAGAVAALGAGLVIWSPWASDEPGAKALELSGDLDTHDPALVVGTEEHDWYVFSTGDIAKAAGSPSIRRSTDGLEWEYVGGVWDAQSRPMWVYEMIPGIEHIWAPDVFEHDGTWYLYYSASTFGSNLSAIGLMTSPTLDPDDPDYGWTDEGLVVSSDPATDNYNAIDPSIVEDADGTPWMAFGSYWGGIQLIELEWPSGKPVDGAEPTTIASRTAGGTNAIEGASIEHIDGYYYLFVSRDTCCAGVDSTYSIAAGRATEITGPYVDSWGNTMGYDGGDEILSTDGTMIGPGGESYDSGYLAYHYYDEDLAGQFQLAIRELDWTEDGWPIARTADELAD